MVLYGEHGSSTRSFSSRIRDSGRLYQEDNIVRLLSTTRMTLRIIARGVRDKQTIARNSKLGQIPAAGLLAL